MNLAVEPPGPRKRESEETRGLVAPSNVAFSCWRDGLPGEAGASRRANQLQRDVGALFVYF